MTYQFSREQAIEIASAVSGSPLTCETLAAALAEFAPDYPYSGMVYGRVVYGRVVNGHIALEDGREFDNTPAAQKANPDSVFVVVDCCDTYAWLPNSNSDGIVQSESMTDEPFASFGIGGMVYC